MKNFMKAAKSLLLTLLLISASAQAKNDCPDVKGNPIKLSGIDNGFVYFGGESIACYFDKENDVMIRVEDTSSVPKLSIFYKSTGKSLLKPDPNYASGYQMLDVAYGLDGELLIDFVKRQKQKFQVYKVKGYKSSLSKLKKDAAWVDGRNFKLTVVDNKYLVYYHFLSPVYTTRVFSIEDSSKKEITAKREYVLNNSQLYLTKEKDKKTEDFKIKDRDIAIGEYIFSQVLSDEYLSLDVKKLSQKEMVSKAIDNLTLFKGKQSNYPQSWMKKSVVRKGKKVPNKRRFSNMMKKHISEFSEGCTVDCNVVSFSNDLEDYLGLE